MAGQERKQQCLICGKEATVFLSPDLDIRGLGACENHKEEVKTAWGIYNYLGEDDFNKFLASCRKKSKRNNLI